MNTNMNSTVIEVQNTIEKAFKNVSINDGLTIKQCVAVDDREDKNSPQYSDITDYYSWSELPDSHIKFIETHGVFSHSGLNGALFYLPAAMIYVVKNQNEFKHYETAWAILSSILFQLEKPEFIQLLSIQQKHSIISWLGYIKSILEQDSVFDEDIEAICQKLES